MTPGLSRNHHIKVIECKYLKGTFLDFVVGFPPVRQSYFMVKFVKIIYISNYFFLESGKTIRINILNTNS